MNIKQTAFILGALIILGALAYGLSFFAPPPKAVCKDCNVIIIGVDTLRADRVHAFGYQEETTPNIDALAAEGVSFTNAVSASNWTVPSFMSIFTGVYPSVHKVVNKYVEYDPSDKTHQVISNLKKLSPNIETLAEAMKKAGYATGGFTGDAGVGHAFGYAQGFDTYTDETTFGGLGNSETHALSWLDSLPNGQKFFMFFHGYDLHGQFVLPKDKQVFVPKDYTGIYTGTPAEEAKLREAQLTQEGISLSTADAAFWSGMYDSKLLSADAEVGSMLAELKKRRLLEHTVVILLADHGEEFYEHGGIDHGQSLYDELVHVPLIIAAPGLPSNVQVPAEVSTMDVAPTVFGILGITPDSVFGKQQEGQSLVPYLLGTKTAGADQFLETDYRDFIHERGIRTADGWKYVINLNSGTEELYNLPNDPGEKDNLIDSEAFEASALRQKVRDHMLNDLKENPGAAPTVGCLPVYPGECQ